MFLLEYRTVSSCWLSCWSGMESLIESFFIKEVKDQPPPSSSKSSTRARPFPAAPPWPRGRFCFVERRYGLPSSITYLYIKRTKRVVKTVFILLCEEYTKKHNCRLSNMYFMLIPGLSDGIFKKELLHWECTSFR